MPPRTSGVLANCRRERRAERTAASAVTDDGSTFWNLVSSDTAQHSNRIENYCDAISRPDRSNATGAMPRHIESGRAVIAVIWPAARQPYKMTGARLRADIGTPEPSMFRPRVLFFIVISCAIPCA